MADVLAEPALFEVVFSAMLGADPIIRMRASDVVEKITAKHPEFLRPYKTMLIEQVTRIEQKVVRWHVAQMLPRLELDEREREQVIRILLEYLNDSSSIVKTFAMQSLTELSPGTGTA